MSDKGVSLETSTTKTINTTNIGALRFADTYHRGTTVALQYLHTCMNAPTRVSKTEPDDTAAVALAVIEYRAARPNTQTSPAWMALSPIRPCATSTVRLDDVALLNDKSNQKENRRYKEALSKDKTCGCKSYMHPAGACTIIGHQSVWAPLDCCLILNTTSYATCFNRKKKQPFLSTPQEVKCTLLKAGRCGFGSTHGCARFRWSCVNAGTCFEKNKTGRCTWFVDVKHYFHPRR